MLPTYNVLSPICFLHNRDFFPAGDVADVQRQRLLREHKQRTGSTNVHGAGSIHRMPSPQIYRPKRSEDLRLSFNTRLLPQVWVP